MAFEPDGFDAGLELVDLDVVLELLDLDMVLLVFEDAFVVGEVDGFVDKLAFDELALEKDEFALEEEVVECKLWLESVDPCEVIFEDEVVVEADDTLVELGLMIIDDGDIALLVEDFELLVDVDSVVGEKVGKVGQRVGGYCPVSDLVVIATVFVIA
jgi:hypothetical protein